MKKGARSKHFIFSEMEMEYLESTHTNIGNHQGRDAREMGGRREWGWPGGWGCVGRELGAGGGGVGG